MDGAPEWPWGLCGGWGRDAGCSTQPESPEGLACSGSPVCREGVGRQVEGVDPPFLPITRTPGGRTLGLGLRAGSGAPGLRAGCCGGLSTGPLRCLTPAFTLMNVRLRKGLQENCKDFPPALHSGPQMWTLAAFAFSPLPSLPPSLPPSALGWGRGWPRRGSEAATLGQGAEQPARRGSAPGPSFARAPNPIGPPPRYSRAQASSLSSSSWLRASGAGPADRAPDPGEAAAPGS